MRDQRRAEILAAFAELANERGLAKCSLRVIAERVGVTMPLLLHHFGSRQELEEALIAQVTDDFRRSYATRRGGFSFEGDPDKLLRFFFGGGFRRLVSDRDALFADLLAASNRDPVLRQRFRELYRQLERVVAEELEAIAPEASEDERQTAAYALVCLLESNEMFLRMRFRDGRGERAWAVAALVIDRLAQARVLGRAGHPGTQAEVH